jgi:hypothetical protein
VTAAVVLLAALLAQAPAPTELALPGYRLHLVVDESVDADALRALAGRGTVLWLRTRSNMLRASTVEALARFPEAYVQLRPPLLEAQAKQLQRAPRAGAWLDAGTLGAGAWHHRLGPRRVAVDVRGPLDAEAARRVAALRPARVTWLPGDAEATLAGWGELAQLPGAKLLVHPGPWDSAPGPCRDEALPGAPRTARAAVSLRVDAGARVDGPPCGTGRRVRVTGLPDDAALVALFSRVPSAELELEVGSDPGALARARAWVERLEAAVNGSAR